MAERDELVAVSDREGRFELRGAKPGMVTARASGPGVGSRLLGVRMPAFGDARELGDVTLAPACAIASRTVRTAEGAGARRSRSAIGLVPRGVGLHSWKLICHVDTLLQVATVERMRCVLRSPWPLGPAWTAGCFMNE